MSSSYLTVGVSEDGERVIARAQRQVLTLHHDLPFGDPVDIDLYLGHEATVSVVGTGLRVCMPASISTVLDLYLACGALLDGHTREKAEEIINDEQVRAEYAGSEL